MGTDPAAAAIAAAETISAGRVQADDPQLALLPDDPLGVVEHVVRHRRVPAAVRRAEVPHAWAVLDGIQHRVDKARLGVLRSAAAAGMSYRDLAPILGVRSRQAVEASLRRLEAAAAGQPKDEHAARAVRRQDQADERRRRAQADDVLVLARWLVAEAAAGRLPADAGDDVGHLAELLSEQIPGDPPSAAVVSLVRLLLRGLPALPVDEGVRAKILAA